MVLLTTGSVAHVEKLENAQLQEVRVLEFNNSLKYAPGIVFKSICVSLQWLPFSLITATDYSNNLFIYFFSLEPPVPPTTMPPTAPPATTMPPTNLPPTSVHTIPPTRPNNTAVGEFVYEVSRENANLISQSTLGIVPHVGFSPLTLYLYRSLYLTLLQP